MHGADIVSGILARKVIAAEQATWLRKETFAGGARDRTKAEFLFRRIERIGRDGALLENEAALLTFIKNNSPKIHASLEPLFKKAGL